MIKLYFFWHFREIFTIFEFKFNHARFLAGDGTGSINLDEIVQFMR